MAGVRNGEYDSDRNLNNEMRTVTGKSNKNDWITIPINLEKNQKNDQKVICLICDG